MTTTTQFNLGDRVVHSELGDGVVLAPEREGYVRVFIAGAERQVPATSLRPGLTPSERVLANVQGTAERARRLRLASEAHALPLVDGAAALTAAPIDLLPHQVVLTHRVATTAPRRFLVADEVGLGKTIETALILRELASRQELKRALMVVPAGLVNNWHRELNEVFRLDFEVFGSEGDVTDRKSNAFVKHDRLIASIDTLKRPARVRRLLEAPAWDLVVFDEAHHLSAYRSGRKVTKTDNFRLAEALKGHTRDLLLLSATPHQGDHFRFWMLIQLLAPTLFNSAEEMVEHRHRLNAVVFRRTKADACDANGDLLFARRAVSTDSFTMSDTERKFYKALRTYLEDGFARAKAQGNQGRALGFVMTIFQKIAASSFAAVRRTLRKRLIMLTLHDALLKEQALDVDGRQALHDEARRLIHEDAGLGDDPVSRSQVDAILAELKHRLIRALDEEGLAQVADSGAGEQVAAQAEDAAATVITVAIPEERARIKELLERFPAEAETKVSKLLTALGTLWTENPEEKVVIFATYLGTVDLLGQAIDRGFPGKGVEVLRGGDHGAKLAAERRFRKVDGPRVLVCTAAGREGINLQFARVLFNFDLPWNPMDVEQRIGRIHRYGQRSTAQVYNLVLSDTIEGRIFLLLEEKLVEIARALGKVDEHGNVAEDLRSQVLGQLSERLSYDALYRDALSDPELRQTKEEVDAALANASEARKVVFQLFQDLDRFNLDDYKPLADVAGNLARLTEFFRAAAQEEGAQVVADGVDHVLRDGQGKIQLRFTTDRERAKVTEGLDLLGLDHPRMAQYLARWRDLPPEDLGAVVQGEKGPAVVTTWVVEARRSSGDTHSVFLSLAADREGRRRGDLEREVGTLLTRPPGTPAFDVDARRKLLEQFESMLKREIAHRGIAKDGADYTQRLVAWIEVSPTAA